MVLVSVDPISLLHDRNCPSDIVMPMGGLVVTRDNPRNILDCVDNHRVVTHLVFVAGMLYHHHDEEEMVAAVFLPESDVRHS